MKKFKSLSISVPNAIKLATKNFGVVCTVYTPITEDRIGGIHSGHMQYEDTPIIKDEQLLIPSVISGQKVFNFSFGDFEFGGEQVLWAVPDLILPRGSLIVVKYELGLLNFITDVPIKYADDEYIFALKYPLYPQSNISVEHNEEKLRDIIGKSMEFDSEFNPAGITIDMPSNEYTPLTLEEMDTIVETTSEETPPLPSKTKYTKDIFKVKHD